MVAAAQLNRQAENRPDNRPKLSDLRESGSIEQDADIVALVHRPAYYAVHDEEPEPQDAEIIIAKHRAGRTGSLNMTWRPSLTRFDAKAPVNNIVTAPRLTDESNNVCAPDKELWEALNE